jgi:outer membrane protein, heavy metal efflux system
MNLALTLLLALPCHQDPAAKALPQPEAVKLSLKDTLRLATTYSLSMQLAESNADSARYERDARWARFDWQLQVDGSLTDAEYEGNSELAGAPIIIQKDQGLNVSLTKPTQIGPTFQLLYSSNEARTNNTYAFLPHSTTGTLSLGITQRLLAGRGAKYNTALQYQAEKEYAFATETRRATKRKLIGEAHQGYWSLVSAQGALESADIGVQFGEEFLRLAKDRYNIGVGLELDILQAETELAKRQETRTQTIIMRMTAEDTLRQFLYASNSPLTWSERFVATDAFPVITLPVKLPDWSTAYKTARETNPEITASMLRLQVAKRLLHVAASDEQSSLDLQFQVRSQGFEESAFEAWSETFDGDYPTMTAAIRWQLPLSGAEPKARTRKTRAEQRRAQLELDSAERSLTSKLRIALRSIEQQSLAYQASERSLELATRQHEVEIARYGEGSSTSMRVLAAQTTLLDSASARITAQAKYVIAMGQFEVLVGQHDWR